jgi:hypothetical protein
MRGQPGGSPTLGSRTTSQVSWTPHSYPTILSNVGLTHSHLPQQSPPQAETFLATYTCTDVVAAQWDTPPDHLCE